jgi:hypothetical protein
MRLRLRRKGATEEAPASKPAASVTVPPLAQSAGGAGQAAPPGAPSVGTSPAIESFKAASEAVKAREAAQSRPRH